MVKYCPECGAKLKENYEFCGKCGHKIPKKVSIIENKSAIDKPKEPAKKEKTEEIDKKIKTTVTPIAPPIRKNSKYKLVATISASVLIVVVVIASLYVYTAGLNNGSDSQSPTGDNTQIISNNPPTVYCSANPSSGCEPLTVYFSGSGSDTDGSIVSWYWVFGDGYTSTSSNPTHVYQNYGTFTAKLTVTDNDGATDSDTITIEVKKDTDSDGLYDEIDIDDDNDGYKDAEDFSPYKDAKLEISILEFEIFDEVDGFGSLDPEGEIYFDIYVNDVKRARFPSTDYVKAAIGITYDVSSDWYFSINVPDNQQTHTINIRMYDDDVITQELLDIDGHDESMGLTIVYDIVTESWTGDDLDGITDGRNDGTYSTDDNDAYLEYQIESI